MMTLTRDKLESIIENIKVMSDYPWHHKLNFILENDQAQRAVIESANKTNEYLASTIQKWEQVCQDQYQQIEQQAKELERLQEVTTAWRNIQQEEMCYVMREIEALGIDINKSVISDGKALWDVCMDRIAELRKAEQENKTLREALQDCLPILKEDIEACGPCDHSVNHCICGLKSLAEQVQHALNNVKAPAERGKETQVLREALQLLYDCQNGCPLPKYETDWNRAMELAARALKEVS